MTKIYSALSPSFSRQLFRIASIFISGIAISACQHKTERLPSPPVPLRKVSALGSFEPETKIRKVGVSSSVAGDRIEEILVSENQHVKKGQPLAKLDSYDSLKASLDEAQQEIAVAQSRLEQVKAGAKKSEIKAQEYKIESLQNQLTGETKTQDEVIARCQYQLAEAKRQYDRYLRLYKDGAVSASEFDRYLVNAQTMEKNLAQAIETRTEVITTLKSQIAEAIQTKDKIAEVRPIDVKVAESQLNKAIATRNRATKDFSCAIVRSPQDGQILKIMAGSGEKVPDEGILEIGDTNKMIVVAEVYPTDIPKIFVGQKATITSDGFQKQVEGTVYELGSQVLQPTILNKGHDENQDHRVFEVKLRLDPQDTQNDIKYASNLQVNVLFEQKPETADTRSQ